MKLSFRDCSYKAPYNVKDAFNNGSIVKTKYDIIREVIELLRAWSMIKTLTPQDCKKSNTICLNYGKGMSSRFIYVQNDKRIITMQNPFTVRESQQSPGAFELVDPITNLVMNARNVSILTVLFNPKGNSLFKGTKSQEQVVKYSPYSCLVDDTARSIDDMNNISTIEDFFRETFDSFGVKNIEDEYFYKWWVLFCRFLSFDSEYVRYDDDIENMSESHPRYHLDINLGSSFKIGVGKKYNVADVFNLLDKNGNTPNLKFK